MEWEFLQYDLPAERIAQAPVGEGEARANSRLLHCCGDGGVEEHRFYSLPDLLRPSDLLILNNTAVVPARFFVRRGGERGGEGAEIELLLLSRISTRDDGSEEWFALARPMKRIRPGEHLAISARLTAECLGRSEDGTKLHLILRGSTPTDSVAAAIEAEGLMPIPPYIREGRADESDRRWYQSVFAAVSGSVAAPTASLHFTETVLGQLRGRGVEIQHVTLHVGSGSFLPIRDTVSTHQMARERYFVSSAVWERIQSAKSEGRRVVVVGTTAVRTVESVAKAVEEGGTPLDSWQETELFITPGYPFRVVDAMVTNFHQPRSTHLVLVATFAGKKRIEGAYRYALEHGFRFLSYGDSMLLERGDGGSDE